MVECCRGKHRLEGKIKHFQVEKRVLNSASQRPGLLATFFCYFLLSSKAVFTLQCCSPWEAEVCCLQFLLLCTKSKQIGTVRGTGFEVREHSQFSEP